MKDGCFQPSNKMQNNFPQFSAFFTQPTIVKKKKQNTWDDSSSWLKGVVSPLLDEIIPCLAVAFTASNIFSKIRFTSGFGPPRKYHKEWNRVTNLIKRVDNNVFAALVDWKYQKWDWVLGKKLTLHYRPATLCLLLLLKANHLKFQFNVEW